MKWIMTSDKLPKDMQEVLFYTIEDQLLEHGHYDKDLNLFCAIKSEHPDNVLFWGAIPKYENIVKDFI